MTQKEYERICEILDKNTRDVWLNPYQSKKYIPSENIPEIKKQINELVNKEKNNG